MVHRDYYSRRAGSQAEGIDLTQLRKGLRALYSSLEKLGYFQEAMGYRCVDEGDVPGTMGEDIEAYFFLRLRREGLYPIESCSEQYTEEDVFDIMELLYDHVSQPVSGHHHTYNDCGWHYNEFDEEGGRKEFREEVNRLLSDYGRGYELLVLGEVVALPEPGMKGLFAEPETKVDPANVEERIVRAQQLFLSRRSSTHDRRDAVKELTDVLEFLRPTVKKQLLKADEQALFNIANNFGIRHHRPSQQTDYDTEIWLSWVFHVYLATLQAVTKTLAKQETPSPAGLE